MPLNPAAPSLRVVPSPDRTLGTQSNALPDSPVPPASPTDTGVEFDLADQLAKHVYDRWLTFRTIRETRGITRRLIRSLRAFRGVYSPQKHAAITRFGGSTVFSQLTSLKCRGATAMLRDVYLGGERPWFVEPTPVPKLPDDIGAAIEQVVAAEVQNLVVSGSANVSPGEVRERSDTLRKQARLAARRKAKEEAARAERHIEDILGQGGFYDALRNFLLNLTVFPYALIKGPFVERRRKVSWVDRRPVAQEVPMMMWSAPSPFDVYWQSGADRFEDGEVVEIMRFTRSQLQSLIGVPGFNASAIREVLSDLGGLAASKKYLDLHESERHLLEDREDPHVNRSNLYMGMEFQGTVPGRLLRTWAGMGVEDVPDIDKDYHATVWVVSDRAVKATLTPNPRKRHNFYMTSYERVPGSLIGRGLPELMADIQDMANAALRSLNNNMGIASGPQVIINDDLVDPQEDGDELYPWKRWHVETSPFGNSTQRPVDFYQPDSRAAELLQVYEKMTYIADEISAIPRYLTGSERLGGAGRTASGLGMLMNAATKVLQSVAANIDQEVIAPMLEQLYELLLLTDLNGDFRGDERVRVRGVVFATQRETERMRALEMLQMTGNPVDLSIIGKPGRAELLREVADRVGLDHVNIVPDREAMEAQGAGLPGLPPSGGAPPQPGMNESLPDNAGAGRMEEEFSGMNRGPSGQTV